MLGVTGRSSSFGGRTIPAFLDAAAERTPSATTLLESDGSPVSYGALLNGSDMAVALLAAVSVGYRLSTKSRVPARRIRRVLNDLAPTFLLSARGLESDARELARKRGVRTVDLDADAEPFSPRIRRDPASSDVALMLHTSGTTSRPRVVPLTHANLFMSATNVAASLELTPADRALMQPHGPYLLGGFRSGALVALELARQLQQRDESVSNVLLVDAPVPDVRCGWSCRPSTGAGSLSVLPLPSNPCRTAARARCVSRAPLHSQFTRARLCSGQGTARCGQHRGPSVAGR